MEIIEIGKHSFCAKVSIRKTPESDKELHSFAEEIFCKEGVSLPEHAEITAYSNGTQLLLFVSEDIPRRNHLYFRNFPS